MKSILLTFILTLSSSVFADWKFRNNECFGTPTAKNDKERREAANRSNSIQYTSYITCEKERSEAATEAIRLTQVFRAVNQQIESGNNRLAIRRTDLDAASKVAELWNQYLFEGVNVSKEMLKDDAKKTMKFKGKSRKRKRRKAEAAQRAHEVKIGKLNSSLEMMKDSIDAISGYAAIAYKDQPSKSEYNAIKNNVQNRYRKLKKNKYKFDLNDMNMTVPGSGIRVANGNELLKVYDELDWIRLKGSFGRKKNYCKYINDVINSETVIWANHIQNYYDELRSFKTYEAFMNEFKKFRDTAGDAYKEKSEQLPAPLRAIVNIDVNSSLRRADENIESFFAGNEDSLTTLEGIQEFDYMNTPIKGLKDIEELVGQYEEAMASLTEARDQTCEDYESPNTRATRRGSVAL